MNKHSRIITAIISAICLLSAAVLPVFAEDVEPSYDEPSYVEPSYVEPSYEEPSYVEPSYVEPSYVEPSYVEPSYVEPSYDEPSYVEPSDNNIVYYDDNGNQYSNPSDVYVGGEQTYDPPASIPDTTAGHYDTSNSKVDSPTLTDSDWEAIKADVSSQGKSSGSDSDSFSSIKRDTGTENNGQKLLILGFALVLLSLVGFIYLIVSTVSRRKQVAAANQGGRSASHGASGASSYRYRSNDDYDDDFDAGKKKTKTPKNGKRYK